MQHGNAGAGAANECVRHADAASLLRLLAKRSLKPHVGLADVVTGGKLGGRAGSLYAPDLEQIGAVDHLKDLGDILLDDQYCVALSSDATDQLEHLCDDDRG